MNELEKAKSIFAQGGYTCVLVKDDAVFTSDKSGIAPLLEIIESGQNVSGFSAADKIIGKAAALLYSFMGVRAVYGEVVSSAALGVLQSRGIAADYGVLTDIIINRRGDGICPMEQAVAEVSSPEEGLVVLKEKATALRGRRE